MANGRSCARIQCSGAGKTGDVPVCVAGDCDLIDATDRAVCCAANEQHIWIVILECQTTIGRWHSRHCAQLEERVVHIERRKYCHVSKGVGRISSRYARCCASWWRFADARSPLIAGRTRPHRERANDGHRCEEQSGREFVNVSFHRCFPFDFWFSLPGNVCHSPSVPGNSGRSSRKFFKRTEFLTCASQGYPEPGCHVWIGVRLPSRGSLL